MVNIGVIGTGKWGLNHIRIFSELGNLKAIADIRPESEQTAKEFNASFYTDYKQLLPEVDAVTVVVPTDKHYEIVKECLNQGKHVLVEKPVTLYADQTKELVELAKQKGLILSVGYLFRFNPAVKKLKELVKDIGQIQYIKGRYIHSSKPPRKDSGAILNLGVHLIDSLNFILEERPKRVYCKKVNLLNEKNEDSATIVLDYEKFFAEFELSCCHPEKKRDMWIIAKNDKIYADFFDQKITRNPFQVTEEGIKGERNLKLELNKNEPLKEELKHFVECVKDYHQGKGSEITNIGEEEYYTTRICELALQSAKLRRDLDVE